jgi:rhodanese-related sulfurtransferase
VASRFVQNGFARAYALEGGWNAWQKAGHPIEAK